MKDSLIIFNRSIYDTYQHLGSVIKYTILWWLCLLPVFTLGPATAGLFYVLRMKKKEMRVTTKDYFIGFRIYFKVGIQITLLYLFVMVPGIVYIHYLFSFSILLTNIIAVLIIYVLILFNLVIFFMFPLMVEQNLNKISVILKRAFRLVSENFSFTLNVALYLLLMTLISSVITIMMVAWAGMVALLSYNSVLYLLSKYNPDEYTFDSNVKWKGIIKVWNK